MKTTHLGKYILTAAAATLFALGASAQTSVPAPGSGGSFTPAPSGGGMGPGMMGPGWAGPGPMAPPPPAWGNPWGYDGYYGSPTIIVNTPVNTDNGVTKVVACGYDAQGIWRTLPLTVAYAYNGVQYNVTVVNAWNPWTDTWDKNVDEPAYNTDYTLNGHSYDFYTVLSTGTYYFNL